MDDDQPRGTVETNNQTVEADIKGIAVVHWNPLRRRVDGTAQPVDNFGDLIGPRIVAGVLARLGVSAPAPTTRRLLSVGSILHFARAGDVVWGTGINGKERRASARLPPVDVRAVRGPATRRRLLAQGIDTPVVFGDPGLLLPFVMPELLEISHSEPTREIAIVPNLNDMDAVESDSRVVDPRGPLDEVLIEIARSRFVVGSSLHGIVVAEALGRPARAIRSASEHYLKYFDYYAGTGRYAVRIADDVDEAVALGGAAPGLNDVDALLAAFPIDLWNGAERTEPTRGSAPEPAEWLLAAGERWAARHAGTPLNDNPERFRREVIAGLLADAEHLSDDDLERGMRLVARAARGIDLSLLSPRYRTAFEIAVAGEAARFRSLSNQRNRGQ